MAANICMRSAPGFDLFSLTSSPGTSSHLDHHHITSFWKDDSTTAEHKYLSLDSVSPPHQLHHHHHQETSGGGSGGPQTTTTTTTSTRLQSMAICAACRMEIVDRFFLRVNPNLEYHAQCLKCIQCLRPLDENHTAFVRNGQTYCRDDYRSMFTTRCTRCHGDFNKTDLVMRAGPHNVFHLDCFSCVACEKRLQTGEEFQIKNNSLYCRADCDSDASGSIPDYSSSSKLNNNNNTTGSSNFDDLDDDWEDEERSTLTSLDHNMNSPLGSPKSDGDDRKPIFSGGSSSSGGGNSKKKKDKQATRVRTVLNEQQLKILKDCYSMNSRPDATLKERLVEMTGLNARVIRVWFQNKRCKDKKRQIQINETRLNSEREEVLNRIRHNGIGPLIVGEASIHVDPLGTTPMEITHFSQWQNSPVSQFAATAGTNPLLFNTPVEMPPFGVMAPVTPSSASDVVLGPPGAAVFPHYSPEEHILTATGQTSPTPSE